MSCTAGPDGSKCAACREANRVWIKEWRSRTGQGPTGIKSSGPKFVAPPPLTLEQERLVVSSVGLVHTVAREFAKPGSRSLRVAFDFDDLLQDGMVGLLYAARRFDPAHGARFATFAWAQIRWRMITGIRHRTDGRSGLTVIASVAPTDWENGPELTSDESAEDAALARLEAVEVYRAEYRRKAS